MSDLKMQRYGLETREEGIGWGSAEFNGLSTTVFTRMILLPILRVTVLFYICTLIGRTNT
jgi:hypothetical protein